MGGTIGRQQPGAIDGGVDLRRRQRGVAEQLLDRAQIAAARQQVGGEGMAQRVRRRAVGQPERAAHPLHRKLHDARRQRPALGADEERPVGRQRIGAEAQIVLDRGAHRRDDRRRACLAALAETVI